MTSGSKYQLFFRSHIVGEAISILCLCFVDDTQAAAWRHVIAETTQVSSQGEGWEMAVGVGRLCGFGQYLSMCLFAVIVAGTACRLGGAWQHADQSSEKVRQLWARSVCESKVLCSNSAKRISFGFAGAVRVTFGIGQALEVGQGGSVGWVTSHGRNGNFVYWYLR